ncbi:MAG: 50S ribosomal protein L16 [bacterium]|nr:50S ribosomal protein L16 [bacterium]
MLTPKKVKHRKWMKGRTRGISRRGTTVSFGSFGLQARESKWISARQLEACRRVIIRYLRKGGKLWIRIFPDKPITKKGAETPMGGGKGSVDHYVVPVKPGRIVFEIEGISEAMAREAFRKAATKLPIRVKFVTRGEASL